MPRPKYYISRPDGTAVPLIAADEIPATLPLDGLPRALTQAEVKSWGLLYLGEDLVDPIYQYGLDSTASQDSNREVSAWYRGSIFVPEKLLYGRCRIPEIVVMEARLG